MAWYRYSALLTICLAAAGGCDEPVKPRAVVCSEEASDGLAKGCEDPDGTDDSDPPALVCTADNADVHFEYEVGGVVESFCARGPLTRAVATGALADSRMWAHAQIWANVHVLGNREPGWIHVVAYSPSAAGRVNRLSLWIPSRRIGTENDLWRGPYNLGCLLSLDYAADDCWGLEDIGYCLADVEERVLPDCLSGWPRGEVVVFRVGYIASNPPSDEMYEFISGSLELAGDITGPGQVLVGSFSGTMRGSEGAPAFSSAAILNGRLRIPLHSRAFAD